MRNIKSIIIGLLLAITILLTLAISASYFYEDQVSQYLIEELNEYLLAEVEVEDVSFSLLKKFPKASLEFENVLAHSKKGFFSNIQGFNTDTLFFAKSIYVQINLFDLLSKNYNVSSIHFDQGNINLFVDHLGDPNYMFWDKEKKSGNKEFSFELKEVKITRSELLFCNDITKFLLKSKINKIDFEGNFSNQNYLMKIKSDMFLNKLNIENIDYILNKNVKANLDLDIINDLIRLKNGDLNLDNLKFGVNGNIEKSGNKKIDLLISGKNLNLKRFIKNLPPKIIDEFPNIIGQKGFATLNLSISGENIKINRPHIEALFLLNDVQLFDVEREIRLSNIYIDGEFTNGAGNISNTSKLSFKNFKANLESSYFEGIFELSDFKNPQIKLDITSELYFEEIKEIFQIDTIDILKGYAETRIKYNGSYGELRSFKSKDLLTKDYTVNLVIKDGELKFKNYPLILNEISGNIDLNKTLYADSLYFKINDNDFLLKGRISKLFEYFNEKEIFNINAKLYSRKLNLNELALLFKTDKSENSETYQLPDKLALQLRLNIENFEAGKFYATDIKGNLNYKPRMFSLHEISFNSMNGKVKAGGVIIQKFNNDFLVKTQSRLTNINMNKMFYSFNNFGQSFITNQNLEGSLTGDVYFSSEWSDKIEIYKNTVSSECDITISNGELNNFEPLLGLSRFIDIDELKKIRFSTLKNKITIRDEQINIPQMDIESTALNLSASGTHQFSNEYSYHVKVLLSDLLSGKMKKSKRKKQVDEKIEEDDKGRVTLYLLIEGDKDKSKVKYDRKAARTVRKENLNDERTELKQILNEEFGWFKKDSSVNNEIRQNSDQDEFEIEFEENQPEQKKEEEFESDQKFVIEWEEDTINNMLQ
ncbi:MAG: AsmA-like C-terminal region-containing protein [Bacteroidales bacterium]|nr:AsmA-like C-terminal region-containing protein [Bacteroidales bacterium]